MKTGVPRRFPEPPWAIEVNRPYQEIAVMDMITRRDRLRCDRGRLTLLHDRLDCMLSSRAFGRYAERRLAIQKHAGAGESPF